jgi:hypothetical protein
MVNGYTPTMKMIPTATSATRSGVSLLSVSIGFLLVVPSFLIQTTESEVAALKHETRDSPSAKFAIIAVARTGSRSLVPDKFSPETP